MMQITQRSKIATRLFELLTPAYMSMQFIMNLTWRPGFKLCKRKFFGLFDKNGIFLSSMENESIHFRYLGYQAVSATFGEVRSFFGILNTIPIIHW